MGQSPLKTRFWKKVNTSGPIPQHCPELGQCWVWIGKRNGFGYGLTWDKKVEYRAHRMSWMLHFGDIPEGICVLHKCDNPACIRPDHLFLGTKMDNVRDAIRKGRQTSCFKGEANKTHKLTNEQVLEIRRRYKWHTPGFGGAALGKEFGVSAKAINKVVRRLSWDHI